MPRKYMADVVNVYMVNPVSPPLISESQSGRVRPCCSADELPERS